MGQKVVSDVAWVVDEDTGRVSGQRLASGAVVTPVGGYLGAVADEAEMLALSAQIGDDCYRSDTATWWRLSALPASTLANWTRLSAATGALRLCFFGDSTTTSAVYSLGQRTPSVTNPTAFTAGFAAMWGDMELGAANTAQRLGTITYDATAKTLTWRAPLTDSDSGDTVGAPVDVSRSGIYYLPSGTAGNGIWIGWFGSDRTYTSGSTTISVHINGFQVYGYGSNGFPLMAASVAGHRYQLAAMPSTCPPGAAGFFGFSGASAQELASASWQWGEIQSDVDVIQIGTNDFAGSVTVASYLASVQSIILQRLAAGTSLVVWTTILPRNSESAANRAKKAAAARGMSEWAATQGGRVAVFDLAGVVTDPATGNFISSYSGDGVHPSTWGAAKIGEALGRYLAALAPAQSILPFQAQDTYDATNNTTGNLIATLGYGQMAGTGGAYGTRGANVAAWAGTTAYVIGQPVLSNGNLYVCITPGTSGSTAPNHQIGTGLDGTVTWLFIASGASAGIATGWTASNSSGSNANIACAKVTRTDGIGGDWQALCAWSTVADAETCRILHTTSISTGLSVGSQYDAHVELQLMAAKNLQALDYLPSLSGVSGRNANALQGQGNDAWPDSNIAMPPMVARVPPGWIASTGGTSFQPYVQMRFSASGVGWAVVLMGRVGIRKVT